MTTSPPEEASSRPPSRSGSFPSLGYFSTPFEKWKEENIEWSSAYTLLDTFETFFDARFDLWERRLKKQSNKIVAGTKEALKRRGIDSNIDKELARLKEKVIKLAESSCNCEISLLTPVYIMIYSLPFECKM
jgi:hypothetical protein